MPEIVNPETHHERSDVNVRALLMFMVIFVVFAAISHFVLWGMFKYFAQMARNKTAAPLTDVLRPPDAAIPQGPRLQPFPNRNPRGELLPPLATSPVVDMEEMRTTAEQALHTTGWVDKQKGIVRVPIDVAKQLTLQRLNAGGVQK
jgi:hypothetical protein